MAEIDWDKEYYADMLMDADSRPLSDAALAETAIAIRKMVQEIKRLQNLVVDEKKVRNAILEGLDTLPYSDFEAFNKDEVRQAITTALEYALGFEIPPLEKK